jgi:uncharacterized membrane protein YkvI
MFNSKISSIVLYILLAVAVGILILFFVGGITPETAGLLLQEPKYTDLALRLSYVYFGIAAVIALAIPIFDVIRQPKGAGGLLVGILLFVAVFVISYLLSSNETIPNMVNAGNVESTIKLVDTGLIATYIFGGVAFLGIFFTEIFGMLNKN